MRYDLHISIYLIIVIHIVDSIVFITKVIAIMYMHYDI